MILHAASHIDHVSAAVIDHVMAVFGDRDAFFVETIELPAGLEVECGLHGPSVGDPPVPEAEVTYAARDNRPYPSRLTTRLPRPTRLLTVIGGPHDGHACVLYTVHGGPSAPQEPGDPSLPADRREAAVTFWREHALSGLVRPRG